MTRSDSTVLVVGRNCRFKDCLDFFYFFICLLYSPLEKCLFYQSSVALMPHVTSTLSGLWPVRLKPFAPLTISLMSPVCPYSHPPRAPHARKLYAKVFILSGWIILLSSLAERAISDVQNSTAGAHVTYDCICEARTCCCALTGGCDTPSVAFEIIYKRTPRFGFGLLHVWLTCLWTRIEFFCAALWCGRNFQSKECFATQAV